MTARGAQRLRSRCSKDGRRIFRRNLKCRRRSEKAVSLIESGASELLDKLDASFGCGGRKVAVEGGKGQILSRRDTST